MKLIVIGNGVLSNDNYPNVNAAASVQTWYLSQELSNLGHNVGIIRASRTPQINSSKITLIGIKPTLLDRINTNNLVLKNIITLLKKIRFSFSSIRILRKNPPDILLLMDRLTCFFSLFISIPKIFIVHSPEAFLFYQRYAQVNNKLSWLLFPLIRFFQYIAFLRSNKVITLNSEMEQKLLLRGINAICIPNGIKISEFNVGNEYNYLLWGGRIDWNKNITNFLEIVTQNNATKQNIVIIGEGPQKKQLLKIIDDNQNILYLPFLPRSTYLNYVKKCSIFLSPSIFETSSTVVLEAMAFGKMVIAKKNMGSIDLITNDKNGFLYENKEQLLNIMSKLNDKGLIIKYGNNARRTAEQHDYVLLAKQYEKIFNTLK